MVKQSLSRSGLAHALGIEPQALLAAPYNETAAIGENPDGCVGNGGTGTEHQDSKGRTGNRDLPLGVMKGNGLVFLVDPAMLDIEVAPTVSKLRQLMEVTHGSSPRRGHREQVEAVRFAATDPFCEHRPDGLESCVDDVVRGEPYTMQV